MNEATQPSVQPMGWRVMFLAIGSMLCIGLMAVGEGAHGSERDAVLNVDPQTLDLGATLSFEPLHREVTVTNSSPKVVTIETVQTSCGCTDAALSPETLPPRGTGVLRFVVRPQLNTSLVQVAVKYRIEGEDRSQTALFPITYDLGICGDIKAVPPRLEIRVQEGSRTPPNDTVTFTIMRVVYDAAAVVSPLQVVSTPEWFPLESRLVPSRTLLGRFPGGTKTEANSHEAVQDNRLLVRQEYVFTGHIDQAAVLATGHPGNPLDGVVTFATGFPAPLDKWALRVTAVCEPALAPDPPQCVFLPDSAGGHTRIIRLAGLHPSDVTIRALAAESDSPTVQVALLETQGRYWIKSTFSEMKEGSTTRSGVIRVRHAEKGNLLVEFPWSVVSNKNIAGRVTSGP